MKLFRTLRLLIAASLLVGSIAHAVDDDKSPNQQKAWWHKRSAVQKLRVAKRITSKWKHRDPTVLPASLNRYIEDKTGPEVKPAFAYNYFDERVIKSVVDSKSRFILMGTGLSETSLSHMNLNNQEKQKRAFALSMATQMKVERMGGDGKLIYLSTAPVSKTYQNYLYRIFNQETFRSLPDDEINARFNKFNRNYISVVYLTPREREKKAIDKTRYLRTGRNIQRRIKINNVMIPMIHDKYNKNTMVGFTAHFTGPFLESMAAQFRMPYLANPSTQAHWIKKSMSRQSFRDAGVRHAPGTYEPAFSVDALVNDIYALLQQIKGKKIIMKLDQSAAGYGNRVMRFDDVTSAMNENQVKDVIRARFDDKEIFPTTFLNRIAEENGGAIIEEFLDCKNYASPASIFMINAENDVTMHYTYDQILGGKDNMVYQGSIGPIDVPDYDEGNLNMMSHQVGMYLSTQGVRGNVGTDFVVCDDETGTKRIAYAIENNVRMTGTSYPFYTLRSIIGEDFMKTRHMKSFDDITVPVIEDKRMRNTLKKDLFATFLRNHPLSLNVKTGKGCLVHNETLRIGKIGISCVGDNRAEVVKLYDSIIEDIRDYIVDHDMTLQHNRMMMTKMHQYVEANTEGF